VVEVRAADGVGVLYRMVSGLGHAGLHVLTALVSTIGPDVVNSFYVRGPDGGGLPHGDARNQVRRVVLDNLAQDGDESDPASPVTGR
jgi:[protein-PII] uridylyltransferase